MMEWAACMLLALLLPSGQAQLAQLETQPLDYKSWKNETVMFVAAHPDDIECGAGGLIRILTRQGTKVVYVITTNGDKGCGSPFCANYSSVQLAQARAGEAVGAAAVLGVPAQNVVLMDYEDGMITSYPEQEIREELVTLMRTWQPGVIFTWYPQMRFDLPPSQFDDLGYHPDHQATARISIDAKFDSGVGRLFPLSGPAHKIAALYVFEFGDLLTHYVDIGSTLTDKVTSTEQHKTQYPNDSATAAQVTQLAETVAGNVKNPDGNNPKYAETFLSFV